MLSGEKKITYDEATNKVYRFSATTKADLTNTYAFRTFVAIPAGKNVSFKIRAMIVEGTYTSDTTYEPYQSQTYPINLGSMELCKIGDYQDYIAKSTGKNLLDETYYNNSTLFNLTTNYFVFAKLPDTFKTKFYANMSLKGTNQSLVFGFTDNVNGVLSGGIRVLDNGTINSNVECDFTNAANVYLAVGNSQMVNAERDIPKIFDNYNIMVSTTSGEQYEPYGKVWYKYGAIGKVVLDGSEDWYTSSGTSQVNFNGGVGYIHNTTKLPCNLSSNCQMPNNNLYFYNTGLALADWKTLLNTTNAIVYVVLATPTTTEITDTTLIEQLDNLEKAYSYDTQTNISQTNQDKPFIISYEAILSLKNVLNS